MSLSDGSECFCEHRLHCFSPLTKAFSPNLRQFRFLRLQPAHLPQSYTLTEKCLEKFLPIWPLLSTCCTLAHENEACPFPCFFSQAARKYIRGVKGIEGE